MQKSINEVNIEIPAALDPIVNDTLRQVTRLHRQRTVRRTAVTLGSFAVFIAAFFAFGYSNPVLASQIPIVGNIFRQVAEGNKISAGNANVAGYGVINEISAAADSTVADYGLTVTEGYSDGNRLQLVLCLDTPEDFSSKYDAVYTDIENSGTLKLNGTETAFKVSSFYLRDNQWLAFLETELTEDAGEAIEAEMTLTGFEAIEKTQDGVIYSEENPIPRKALEGEFTASFEVTVDRANEFAFECSAEDNGAIVSAVSGTPIETVISVFKPFWGEPTANYEEDAAYGIPELITMDGTAVEQLYNPAYNAMLREEQQADIHFDGLPAGTKKAVLRFHKDNEQYHNEILAEFTIDFEARTATPSKTYDEEGELNINSPYAYFSIQDGAPGTEQNGFTAELISFTHLNGYTGMAMLSMNNPLPESGVNIKLTDNSGNVLIDTNCIPGEENESWDVLARSYELAPDDKKGPPYSIDINGPVYGLEIPIGSEVTTTVTDIQIGAVLLTDTRTLNNVHYR